MMNKKGQLSTVVYAIVVIILTGFLLAVFQPVVNEFRLERIADASESSGQYNALQLFFLYSLIPIIWLVYIFLSLVVIFVSVNSSGGGF